MRLSDFIEDADSGVRLAPSSTPAGYLDGAERHLAEVLARVGDRSVASDELAAHVHDWPTLYHLSPYRTTLFDAFGWTGERARVLELGAGCGAITRWLGEHAREVHAVEGDVSRAQVARLRTADLDNVQVYAGNFSELEEEDFDVVTLIGVLEYSHLYHPVHGGDPAAAAAANLKLARRSLADDGVLVLAIENRMGLKYFNGAPEDHSGKPYESVHGYPHATGAVTFSARELGRLLAEAGFDHAEWFLPFPDYKLPSAILNAEHATPEHDLHNWIGTPAPARGVERGHVAFNETLAFREAAAAGLLAPLANSFLVLAHAGDPAKAHERLGLDTEWVARHWSLDRRPEFRKRVTLRAGNLGPAVVDHESLGRASGTAARGAVRQELGREPFRRGDSGLVEVFETLAAEGTGERFLQHVRELRDWVLIEHGTGLVDGEGLPLVDGAGIDATWWNLIRDPLSGTWQAIDDEFTVAWPVPLDWVVWRSLRHLAERHCSHVPGAEDPNGFAAKWTTKVFPDVGPERLAGLLELELALGRAIGPAGRIPPPPDGVDVLAALEHRSRSRGVYADVEAILREPQLLSRYAAAAPGDVTLLLHAAGYDADTLMPALAEALREAGCEEEGPDMLLLLHPAAGDGERRAVAARCAATIGEIALAEDVAA
jgi:SAM-dependent methyltransferase